MLQGVPGDSPHQATTKGLCSASEPRWLPAPGKNRIKSALPSGFLRSRRAPDRICLFWERECPWKAGSAYSLDPALRVFLTLFASLVGFSFYGWGYKNRHLLYEHSLGKFC